MMHGRTAALRAHHGLFQERCFLIVSEGGEGAFFTLLQRSSRTGHHLVFGLASEALLAGKSIGDRQGALAAELEAGSQEDHERRMTPEA